MAKSKDRSEIESLRGKVKELQKENKHLKRQLSRNDKRAHQYEDLEDKLKDIEDTKEQEVYQPEGCPECSGPVREVDLGIRKLLICDNCGNRQSKR